MWHATNKFEQCVGRGFTRANILITMGINMIYFLLQCTWDENTSNSTPRNTSNTTPRNTSVCDHFKAPPGLMDKVHSVIKEVQGWLDSEGNKQRKYSQKSKINY